MRAWVVFVYGIGGTIEKRLTFLTITAGVSDLQSFLIVLIKANDQRNGTPFVLIISALDFLFHVGGRIAVSAAPSSQGNPSVDFLVVARSCQILFGGFGFDSPIIVRAAEVSANTRDTDANTNSSAKIEMRIVGFISSLPPD